MPTAKKRKISKTKTEDWSSVLTGVSLLGNAIQALDRKGLNFQLDETKLLLRRVVEEKDHLKEALDKLSNNYTRIKAEVSSLDEINRQLKQALNKSKRDKEALEAKLARLDV